MKNQRMMCGAAISDKCGAFSNLWNPSLSFTTKNFLYAQYMRKRPLILDSFTKVLVVKVYVLLISKIHCFFQSRESPEVGIYKKKDKKVRQTRKHAFHQENKQEKEKKKTENMLSTKKAINKKGKKDNRHEKRERKHALTQVNRKNLVESFFLSFLIFTFLLF